MLDQLKDIHNTMLKRKTIISIKIFIQMKRQTKSIQNSSKCNFFFFGTPSIQFLKVLAIFAPPIERFRRGHLQGHQAICGPPPSLHF